MNTELLLKVKAAILAEPKTFQMWQWVETDSDSPCGTSACIAGHAVAIDRGMKRLNGLLSMDESIESKGCQALELTPKQANTLFFRVHWPTNFSEDYEDEMDNGSAIGMAQSAAARIDHFIATDGRE